MGLREITDTFTLESALRKTLDKLSLIEDDPEAASLLVRGATLHRMMQAWNEREPDGGGKYETMGAVLQLLASAVGVLERAGLSLPPSSGRPQAGSDGAGDDLGWRDTSEQALGLEEAPLPSFGNTPNEGGTADGDRSRRRAPTPPSVPPARSLLEEAFDAVPATADDILRVSLLAWEEPHPGLWTKCLHDEPCLVTYCRINPGTSVVPSSVDDVQLFILDGLLRIGDETVSGGMSIHLRPPMPVLYAVGETTLLMIGGSPPVG